MSKNPDLEMTMNSNSNKKGFIPFSKQGMKPEVSRQFRRLQSLCEPVDRFLSQFFQHGHIAGENEESMIGAVQNQDT